MWQPVRRTCCAVLAALCLLPSVTHAQGLSPAAQAAQSGLPRLTEFILRPGDQPYVYQYKAPADGQQRLVAAWGTVVDIALVVTGSGNEPILGQGNPATVRFTATRGTVCTVTIRPAGALPVASVGELYGGLDTAAPTQPAAAQVQTPPALPALNEDFEVGAADRWLLVGEAAIGPTGAGQALTARGMAFGVPKLGDLTDARVDLRYRHGTGMGDIALRVKGLTPPEHLYHVMIATEGLAVIREAQQKPQELGRALYPLRSGSWHDIGILLQGGRIVVEVDGTQVIDVTDTTPLPAGYIGFGSLAGEGFAYDDIVFSLPATPGRQVEPPVTTPPGAQTGAVLGGSLSLLEVPAAQALQKCGIGSLEALAPRVNTPAGLAALSAQSGVSAEHLLFLAQAAELAGVTGAEGLQSRQIAALLRMDISRPDQLLAQRANSAQFRESLHGALAQLDNKAPSDRQVAEWMQASASRPSALDLRSVITSRVPDMSLLPAQKLWLGDGGPGAADTMPPPADGSGGLQTYTVIATLLPPPVTIPPGQEYVHEFDAHENGLYRIDYSLVRPGGEATFAWSIDRPIEEPQTIGGGAKTGSLTPGTVFTPGLLTISGGIVGYQIKGWTPLIQGGAHLHTDVPNARGHLAYFWVKASDIGWNRKLRLRLTPATNVETLAKGDATGIEQGAANDQKVASNPTVTGKLSVSYMPPDDIFFGGRSQVDFCTVRHPDLSPLNVLRTPRLQRLPSGQNPWGMTVRFQPDPNTWAPYMVDPITGGQTLHNVGQYYGGQLVCNDQPVAGAWQDDKGIKTFSAPNPQPVVYYVLVGPWADTQSFQRLTTTGDVLGSFKPGDPVAPSTLRAIEVKLDLQGGGEVPAGALVAELVEIGTSCQAEEDAWDQDNDEGLGDFQMDLTAVLSVLETDAENRLLGLGGKPLGAAARYPVSNHHFQIAPVGSALLCFPRAPIGWWPMDMLQQYDQLQFGGRLWEDDDYNNWSVLTQIKDVVFKMLETVWAMWKGDAGGFLNGMKGYVEAIANIAPLNEEDELIGFACVGTTRHGSDWGFIAEDSPKGSSPDEMEFAAVGPNRSEALDCHEQIGAGGHSLGYVSNAAGGESNATMRIRLRRNVPVVYSWAEVQLLDFTVIKDLDSDSGEQQPPMEVYVSGGFGGCGEYKWNPQFRHDLLGNEDEDLGYDLRFWDWDVVPKQQVVVAKPSPPPCRQEGGVLLPLFHKGPLEPMPYTYTEIGLWDADPGRDDLIGIFSRTFYHDEMRRLATEPATAGKWIISGANTLKPSRVKYQREGPFYTAEIIAHNTGNWIDEIHLKVWLYIWEG
ncbi:MAG TPA: hypothetical protein DGT21_13410 [Armatimonadetes bacterium]|nr:hypothetical protein [Armatimonadota bacterium]